MNYIFLYTSINRPTGVDQLNVKKKKKSEKIEKYHYKVDDES